MSVDSGAVARKFAAIITELLTADELTEVNRLNKTPEYVNCCATHNHVDANMYMLQAYADIAGVEEDDVDLNADDVYTTMNTAWDTAKANNFWVTP